MSSPSSQVSANRRTSIPGYSSMEKWNHRAYTRERRFSCAAGANGKRNSVIGSTMMLNKLGLSRATSVNPTRGSNLGEFGVSEEDEESAVKNYLINHPKIIDEFIKKNMTMDKLEEIVMSKKKSTLGSSASGYKLPQVASAGRFRKKSIIEISKEFISGNDADSVTRMFEITNFLAHAMRCDGYSLYIPIKHNTCLEIFHSLDKREYYGPIGKELTVAAHVADVRLSVLVTDLKQDTTRFPKGVGLIGSHAYSVICMPVILTTGDLVGIIELTRDGLNTPFDEVDFATTKSVVGWLSAMIHQTQMFKALGAQEKLNEFLLETTRVIFDEMIVIDTLIQNIMSFTKDLVKADRCALFLLDNETNELYADYFDEGLLENGKPVFSKKKQIRFPADRGIAGYVCKTKEVVNIPEAYEDDRFNRDIDKSTGYRTQNILCMPIMSDHNVVGVVQMINKLGADQFTHGDQAAFQMFAVYCALALHYSRLYSLLKQSQDKYRVAMDVLNYHMACSEEEYHDMVVSPILPQEEVPVNLYEFDFCCYEYDDILVKLCIKLIHDMFGEYRFDLKKLCRFFLTVKKNYRPVLYHNWQHGFHVAHSAYMMIKQTEESGLTDLFTDEEKLAIVVGGFCHDVDHRGYNNAYFQKLHLPLAGLYSTSVMEQHHYKHTVTILQTEGCDIFSNLRPTQYKTILALIRDAIMSTDLALYFGIQKRVAGQVEQGIFSLEEDKMKADMKSLMMTGADLCAIAKPWETQQKTVDLLYEEFYMQGDKEKEAGLDIIPMMDRTKRDSIPSQQIGFINFICMPLYGTLSKVLPAAEAILDGTKTNLDNWKEIVNPPPPAGS